MAMGVTVWDPQNGRIVSAGRPGRNAQTKIEASNRPNCERNERPERSGTPDDPQNALRFALMRPSLFLEGPNGYGGDRLGPPKRPNCERRNAQSKIEASNRPNYEGIGLPERSGTARNARAENGHQIARIVSGMGARNAPERQMIPKPLLERPGGSVEIEPQYRPTVRWNQASSLIN